MKLHVVIRQQLPTARHRKAGWWVLVKDEFGVTKESIWCHTEDGAMRMRAARQDWINSLEKGE